MNKIRIYNDGGKTIVVNVKGSSGPKIIGPCDHATIEVADGGEFIGNLDSGPQALEDEGGGNEPPPPPPPPPGPGEGPGDGHP